MEDFSCSDDELISSLDQEEAPLDVGLINSLFVRGFSRFQKELRIEPKPGMNLFVGPNNCGKSSLLCFLHLLPQLPGPTTKDAVLSGVASSPLFPKELSDLINMFGDEAEVGQGGYRWKLFVKNGKVHAELLHAADSAAPTPAVAFINGLASRKRDAMEDEFWPEMCRQLEGEKSVLLVNLQEILDLEGTFSRLRAHEGDLWANLKGNQGRDVRLSSHSGMGLKQALVIAFEILSTEARVLVLDEPLAELHWRFLSAFMDWMRKQKRQYFIATHSSQIMDSCWGEGVYLLPSGEYLGGASVVPHTLVQIFSSQHLICVEGNDKKFLRAWNAFNDAVPKDVVFLTDNFWHDHVLRLSQALKSFSQPVAKKIFVLHDMDYYKTEPVSWEEARLKHSIFHYRLSVRHVECLGMDKVVVKKLFEEHNVEFDAYWKHWVETMDGKKALLFKKARNSFESIHRGGDIEEQVAIWDKDPWDWIYWKKHRSSFWKGLKEFDVVNGGKLKSFSDIGQFAYFAQEFDLVPSSVLELVDEIRKCFDS